MSPANSDGQIQQAFAVDASAFVRSRLSLKLPKAAIVLGSGLGGLSERIDDVSRVAYSDIPGFATSQVEGHRGELVHGRLGDTEVVAFAGRFHMYEGHSAATAAMPVRLAHALGIRIVVISNAAGAIRRTLRPGQLVAIEDHINLAFANPLAGPVVPGDSRFPDMSQPYDPELRTRLHAAAASAGVSLEDGVYAWLSGPTYETPAEVRMLERLGADMVGMSTVPEVLVARACGMRVAGVSCITNMAAGIGTSRLDHSEVLSVTAAVGSDFERLIEKFVTSLPTAD